MTLLLDTCTFLWISLKSPELSPRALKLFQDPGNDVYLSTASAWEISVKASLGRLSLPQPASKFVPHYREAHKIRTMPIDEESALQLERLPSYHRDPFDRMLVCQSIIHGLTILTPDELISQYPVRVVW